MKNLASVLLLATFSGDDECHVTAGRLERRLCEHPSTATEITVEKGLKKEARNVRFTNTLVVAFIPTEALAM
ncbi:hypothetical protein AC579_1763 [Pseudocercospora musae]|uniref:Uncharacterized protein n=1 Tax=Pseudocercospora musae TaxID=113226 RepID=A0A139IPK2_9PEZI|nr:hypothetical protein AC579_1763 [Pseudocercospora musae]